LATPRSIAQSFSALRTALSPQLVRGPVRQLSFIASLATALGLLGLALRSRLPSTWLAPLYLLLLATLVVALLLVQRSVKAEVVQLTAQAQAARAAQQLAEARAAELAARRDRLPRLEVDLNQLQRLESVGRLASSLAHDFSNLLTVIGASTSMAERAIATGACPSADLAEVREAVSRASGLTQQLFAFAQKQTLSKHAIDLNQLVDSIERVLGGVIGDGTRLHVKLGTEPLRLLADAAQLEQLVVNLVINARDAVSGHGEIEIVTYRVSHQRPEHEPDGIASGEYACIEVRDNGAGMSADVREHLFEPFFTTKAPGRGNGLGLSTCFGIARQHDGAIHVESEAGRGTVMRVLLPLAAQLPNVRSSSGSGMREISKPHARVLVAEDEPQVRAVAARALTAAGFEVLQASNGAIGLTLFKSQAPFDVLVTDVVMPELSGPELASAARTLDPEVGLVFMSGYPEAMQSAPANTFVGAAFLAKPFAPQALVEAVRERVKQRQAELRDSG
jgi:two-component system, cell cycle sensor histidine kinase and response regulator CckA